MQEEWKDIKDYEGIYQVSNLGRVKHLEQTEYTYNYRTKTMVKRVRKERILSCKRKENKYITICLSKDGKHIAKTLHRIVAETFIPNPYNKEQVNHINGIKTDNRVENLEWCSASENVKHAFRTGLKKVSDIQIKHMQRLGKYGKKRNRKVRQLTLDGKLIKEWNSFTEIYNTCGYHWGDIGNCCRGKYKKAYGYKWEYGGVL